MAGNIPIADFSNAGLCSPNLAKQTSTTLKSAGKGAYILLAKISLASIMYLQSLFAMEITGLHQRYGKYIIRAFQSTSSFLIVAIELKASTYFNFYYELDDSYAYIYMDDMDISIMRRILYAPNITQLDNMVVADSVGTLTEITKV